MLKYLIILFTLVTWTACAQNYIIRSDSLRASETTMRAWVLTQVQDTSNVHNMSYANRDSITAINLIVAAHGDTNTVFRNAINALSDSNGVYRGEINDAVDSIAAHLTMILHIYDSLQVHNTKLENLDDSLALFLELSGGTLTGSLQVLALYSAVQTISASTIDCSLSNNFTKSISANTNFIISNMTAGQVVNILVANTGSYTLGWSTTVLWSGGVAPTLTESGTDIFTLIKIGSNIYGTYVQDLQ